MDWWFDAFLGEFLAGHVGSARLGFYFQRAAKIGDFFFDEQAVAALRNTIQTERAEADAFQFFNGMLRGGKHAAQNIFFGILQSDFIPEISGVATGGVGLAHGADRRTGIAAEALQLSQHQAAFNFHVIGLLKIGPVFEHFGGEVAVIGQKDEAAGVVIEAAHGVDALRKSAETIAERFAAFGIGESGDDLGRLVHDDVNAALVVGFDEFAGGFDAIMLYVGFGAEFGDDQAVDADLAA